MRRRGRPVTFKATRPPAGMGYDAALKLLQLQTTYDVATVKAAFARLVKVHHPDTADEPMAAWMTLPGNEGHSMAQLKEARDVLLQAALGMNRACKLCRGVGQVRGSVGWRQCGACKGTGDKA